MDLSWHALNSMLQAKHKKHGFSYPWSTYTPAKLHMLCKSTPSDRPWI